MKKVLLVTIVKNENNCGQRLQAYSLCKFLNQNFDVDTRMLDCRKDFSESTSFLDFQRKHIPTIYSISSATICEFDPDLTVLGSDQVLNPLWNNICTDWLKAIPNAKKLISYGSSDGGMLSKENKKIIQLLDRFECVSVREDETEEKLKSILTTKVRFDIDPVFLLKPEDWRKLAKKPKMVDNDQPFDFCYYFDNKPNETIISEDGVKTYIYYRNNVNQDGISPDEFVWMIMNCRKLVSSSFHALCFGIMFGKRMKLTNEQIGNSKMAKDSYSLKRQSLLRLLKCDVEDNVLVINPISVKIIDEKRNDAIAYFSEHLPQNKSFIHHRDCTGCMSCKESCGKNTISVEWINGFRYPTIQSEKCVNCKKCNLTCQGLEEEKVKDMSPTVFLTTSKSLNIQKNSSSGGFIKHLSRLVVDRYSGVVYGVAFAKDFKSCHFLRATTFQDIDRQSGSKYLESDSIPYGEIRNDLENGRTVLFTGLPCQTHAVDRKFREFNNLIVATLICNAVPSSEKWKAHIESLEKLHDSNVVGVNMRYNVRDIKYEFENGETVIFSKDQCQWRKYWLYGNLTVRPSCVICRYKYPNIFGDFIVGDGWGFDNLKPANAIKQGIVFQQSEHAKSLIEQLRSKMDFTDVSSSWRKTCELSNRRLFYGR